MKQNYQEDTLLEEKVVTKKEDSKSIILFNDDINSFEWVILCLHHKCNHTLEQAEQCALIVHNSGKCSVKNGSYKALLPIHQSLLDAGLTTEII